MKTHSWNIPEFAFRWELRIYQIPTCEKKIVIQTPWNLSSTYNKVYSSDLANKIDPQESILEYFTSKVW